MIPLRKPIVSWNEVRKLIGFDEEALRSMADRAGGMYRSRDRGSLRRGKWKWRHIDDPVPELKRVQKALVRGVLRPLILPACFCGSVSGRSPADAVRPHVGRPSILALDLRDFFPRTNFKRVYRAWTRVVGCSPDIARVLTKLTTHHRKLPQGAPSSPNLANLAFLDIGLAIVRVCESANLRATFFVDDILISGDRPAAALNTVLDVLQRNGYGIKREKMEFMGPRDRHRALGTVFNRFVSYGREPFAILRNRVLRLRDEPLIMPFEIRSLTGAAHYVRSLNEAQGERLLALLSDIRPTVADAPRADSVRWAECRGGVRCLANPQHRHASPPGPHLPASPYASRPPLSADEAN